MIYLLLYSFLYSVYFVYTFYILYTFVTSHKICISWIVFILSCDQRFFSKMKLLKSSLRTQSKQAKLEIQLYISTESPREVLIILFFNISWIK